MSNTYRRLQANKENNIEHSYKTMLNYAKKYNPNWLFVHKVTLSLGNDDSNVIIPSYNYKGTCDVVIKRGRARELYDASLGIHTNWN